LVHRLPFPPDKGDRIRAFHVLKFLAALGPVHLATLADEPVSSPDKTTIETELGKFCSKLAIVPVPRTRAFRILWSLTVGKTASEGAFDSPELRQTLKTWTRENRYRACIVSSSGMTPYLRMPELQGVPAIVDLVDVDSQKWLDYAAASRPPRSWLYRLEAQRLRRLESALPAWARAVTLVSELEADLLSRFAQPGRVEVISNGVDLDYFQPRSEPESGCVFTGALDYWPNIEGISWFCKEVWPEIYLQQENTRLSIVGRRPASAVRRLETIPGVEVVGEVPDVRPYYARAAVVVAPLRITRGIQNKLLEAMAMSKALVASPACLQGVHAQPDVHLLRADSADDWQQTILRLIDNPGLRRELGQAGRRFVEDRHRWDRCLEPLGRLLDEVASTDKWKCEAHS
jgi:sugar transferase (PEP-CTERM/EpsH1 system associated)